MPTKNILIIARHGNTFRAGETPTRVGARTDLPLVESHRGESIGKYLKDNDLTPAAVYASPLRRAVRTAELALEAMGIAADVQLLDDFTEIDYGPDENKTEQQVEMRLGDGDRDRGRAIIDAWNREAEVPQGWIVDPAKIIKSWEDFAQNIAAQGGTNKVTLLVTSNGIIRFAPYLTGDFDGFAREHDIKVATGGVCIFEENEGDQFWTCTAWDIKPYKLYSKL